MPKPQGTAKKPKAVGVSFSEGVDVDKATWLKLRQELADAIIWFRRDFFLLSEQEMKDAWFGKVRPITETAIRSNVPDVMRKAIENGFEDHLPLWEFTKRFFYDNIVADAQQQAVSAADFYLYEPLQRNIASRRIQHYLLSPPDPSKMGLADFEARGSLKTSRMVATAAWMITRHRVVFEDFLCIRFIHDTKELAIDRTNEILRLFRKNSNFRELYDECCLSKDARIKQDSWNLEGREEHDRMMLDNQVIAIGMESTKQGTHPHITFIDDVENEDHINSPAERKKTAILFGALQFSTRTGLAKNLLSGTFYTRLGVHARVMEMAQSVDSNGNPKQPLWDLIHIPCAYNWDPKSKPEDRRTLGDFDSLEEAKAYPGEVLTYPIILSHEQIQAKLDADRQLRGDDLFARMQLFLDFRVSGKVEFNMARWHQFDLGRPQTPFEHKIVGALGNAFTMIQIDSAWKNPLSESGRGAKTAIEAWAYPYVDGDVHRVLLDAIYDDTLTLDEGCTRAIEMAMTYRADKILVEEPGQKTNGPTLDRIARERGARYFLRMKKLGSSTAEGNIIPVVPRQTGAEAEGKISSWKMARFKKWQSIWNSGLIHLNSEIDCLEGLREELDPFPFGKIWDFLDGASLSDDERLLFLMPQSKFRPSVIPGIPRLPKQTIQISRYTGLVERRRWR